jgi:hypothetical protein
MFGKKMPDALRMKFDSNRTWREDNPDTVFDHMNGVIYQFTSRIDKFMGPFYECIVWILTFISMLIWIAAIAFLSLVAILLVVAIVTGLLGIDLTPAAEIAAAMK